MRVLVAAASRHGATQGIAEAVGRALVGTGHDVDVMPLGQVDDVDGYGAFVLGSAIYMGRWLDSAREFVDVRGSELTDRPVWLFSSGPIGNPPQPSEEHAVDVGDIIEATGAREHRLFPGRIDTELLSFGERAVMLAVHGVEGDFRDWAAITEWASGIGRELAGVA